MDQSPRLTETAAARRGILLATLAVVVALGGAVAVAPVRAPGLRSPPE